MDRKVLAAYERRAAGCTSEISVQAAITSIVSDGKVATVYGQGKLMAWRLYGGKPAPELAEAGIRDGSMLTHVCEVPAAEAILEPEKICCRTDASKEITATFLMRDGKSKTISVKRSP